MELKDAILAEIEKRQKVISNSCLAISESPESKIENKVLSQLKSFIKKFSSKESCWHDAQGEYLPEIDREVVVLYQPYPLEGSEFAVTFAHRPNDKCCGYTIERYGKGRWNIPNVIYWLDSELPVKHDKP